jgi:hypothetical protein
MPEQIVFKNSAIWDSDTNGIGWAFSQSPFVAAASEARAPLGTGTWVKPAGVDPVQHSLECEFRASAPATIKTLLEGKATFGLGTLTVPGHGTFTRCRLTSIGTLDTQKSSDDIGYIVRTTLTFTQYPA